MRRHLSAVRQASIWGVLAALACVLATAALGAALLGLAGRQDGIQESRAESVLSTCREQNERHDNTVAALDRVLDDARRDASPERLRQIERSRVSTLLLIDALAPKRDCVKRTLRLVGELPD